MKIRPFESKDADAVASIYRAAAEEAVEREPNHYRLPPEELAVEHFGQFKTSEKELILVAEEGEVIGFVQILITHGGSLSSSQGWFESQLNPWGSRSQLLLADSRWRTATLSLPASPSVSSFPLGESTRA